MKNSILIRFGTPKHGWLPVIFHHRNFHLDFGASDALNDPIDELFEAVTQEKGLKRITWWLEPEAYFFDVEKNGENVILKIYEMEDIHDENETEKLIAEIVGNEKDIIEPILNALKQFSSNDYEENHWPYKLEKGSWKIN